MYRSTFGKQIIISIAESWSNEQKRIFSYDPFVVVLYCFTKYQDYVH